MKTIRLLRNLGEGFPRWLIGQEVDADDSLADHLIERQLAELVKAVPPEPIRAVPDNPSIVAAESKLKEIKDRWMAGEGADEAADESRRKPKRQTRTKPDSKEP